MVLTIQKEGYFLEYSSSFDGNEKESVGQFCGKNQLTGGMCGNCRKPFLVFAKFDSARLTSCFSVGTLPEMVLVYCWTCSISEGLFFYEVGNQNSINVIQFIKGKPVEDFPYGNYPEFFPEGRIRLRKIPKDIQSLIENINSKKIDEFDVEKKNEKYIKPAHQFGGEPYLIDGKLEIVFCPKCSLQMPFLASIADDCIDSRGFTGNSYVQIVYLICISCWVVGAYQRCD